MKQRKFLIYFSKRKTPVEVRAFNVQEAVILTSADRIRCGLDRKIRKILVLQDDHTYYEFPLEKLHDCLVSSIISE